MAEPNPDRRSLWPPGLMLWPFVTAAVAINLFVSGLLD